ncbi:C-type lectin domain family 4 member G [Octodon degus]|uniref:C-type lectin domain family 4 member G n=1 Tax=Octodon degus TaxID=10160 RepID=A0A6P3FKA0_OCTDE|nr:C-type lectin domain family 4 member G [Octodon degus]
MAREGGNGCRDPKDVSGPETKSFPGRQVAGRQDKSWRCLCVAMSLNLVLVVTVLSVILPQVLWTSRQLRTVVTQLEGKVALELANAGHARDTLRAEMFRQLEVPWAGNRSSCQPCDAGWGTFWGSCYLIRPGNYSWRQALQACEQVQAHLVIINSWVEQTTAWIGLYREAQEGTYWWINSSALTYTNWEPGEPRGEGPAPGCGAILPQGAWSSFSCSAKELACICERRQSC